MLDQIGLKVQKYQSISQMRPLLKNGCETSQCPIGDRWSNNRGNSVIVIIVVVISLIVDDHVVQDDANMHNQIESALKVRYSSIISAVML
jgi:hypothetical protein